MKTQYQQNYIIRVCGLLKRQYHPSLWMRKAVRIHSTSIVCLQLCSAHYNKTQPVGNSYWRRQERHSTAYRLWRC